MTQSKRYPEEVKARAVRLVHEQREHYPSQWAAVVSVASKIGCTGETLRSWIHKSQIPKEVLDEKRRLQDLERENRELRRANEILRKAAAFFAQAELDRKQK